MPNQYPFLMRLTELSSNLSFDDVKGDLLQYYVGAVVLAIISGIGAWGLCWAVLKVWRKEG